MLRVIWKDVVGYEGLYEVSNTGQVRGLPKTVAGNHLKPTRNIPARTKKQCLLLGYPAVTLFKDGVPKLIKVHRLVATAYIEPKEGCNVVNHLDSDKTNNNVTNLEWTTEQGNVDHKVLNNRQSRTRGEKCGTSILTEKQVREILALCASKKYTGKEIADMYGVSQPNISRINTGKGWPHIERLTENK